MGRPFDAEMFRLEETYAFASTVDVDGLSNIVKTIIGGPIVSVGSGGAYSAAAFLRKLHERATGFPSVAATPLELESFSFVRSNTAIFLVSARGRNVDILAAAEAANRLEPSFLCAIVATAESALLARITKLPFAQGFSFTTPGGRDGYLATNSLLATNVILHRAYARAMGASDAIPSFSSLIGASISDLINEYDRELGDLWTRDVLLVLHGPDSSVAAIDLESKLTEAALIFTKTADLRSFAHGRHHWLTRFEKSTGVLTLSDRRTKHLARRTSALLPASVVNRTITLRHDGLIGEVEALVRVFAVTASLGHAKRVDPGRPGVASFGSRLYRLSTRISPAGSQVATAAAVRKVAAGATYPFSLIEQKAKEAIQRFRTSTFGAIVFDLDGTLLAPSERWALAGSKDLRIALGRLLDNGVGLGVATGRDSTEKTFGLLRSFFKRRHWSQVLIGFCNGARLGKLDEGDALTVASDICLDPIADLLRLRLANVTDIDLKVSATQLTLHSKSREVIVRPEVLFTIAEEAVASCDISAKVLRSSHSVDIVSRATSKNEVVRRLQAERSSKVLRCGDTGAWPGNDFEFLADPYGLSVDRVSLDLDRCWNLLPAGVRSVNGVLHYLATAVMLNDGTFTLEKLGA
jgi:fructoselysine-6-P-deglycase FrlB-like protein